MALREHAERVVARIEMAWEEGDIAVIADMIHPHASLVPRTGGPSAQGRELFLRYFRRWPGVAFVERLRGGGWQVWEDTAVSRGRVLLRLEEPAGERVICADETWVLSRSKGLWSVVFHATCDALDQRDATSR
jgi:hypothetical protein